MAEHNTAARQTLDLAHLPALPAIAHEILRTFNDEFTTGEDIAGIVEKDPGITARLVAIANSAYFGQRQPVTDMRDIVLRVLGTDNVRGLALAIATANTVDTRALPFGADVFWRESFIRAEACRLAMALTDGGGDEDRALAYTCGFCGDIGLLALVTIAPDETQAAVSGMPDSADDNEVARAFLETVGWTPQQATAELARNWGMPDALCKAYESRAESRAGDLLGTALSIASAVVAALRCSDADGDEDTIADLPETVADAVPAARYVARTEALVSCLLVS